MNTPAVESHASNADLIVELMEVLGVAGQAMVMGFSTGGGIAFHMAARHPNKIKAAFLTHSIPLGGLRQVSLMLEYILHHHSASLSNSNTCYNISIPFFLHRYLTAFGELTPLVDLDHVATMSTAFPTDDPDVVYELIKSMSTNKEGFVPRDHKLTEYIIKAAQNMPGKVEVALANAKFNVTPIKTPFSPPSDELSTLKSKVIVIHGSEDFIVPWKIVESMTNLAIIEQWAPKGLLSLYDDGTGHMSLIDRPRDLAGVYRHALEEQVLM
jgi:pimeloyl-ACP methyl ester carboxylesterase